MTEGEPKRYNTNPLDKRVAERAEAEMGAEDVDTEAPTRAMPPAPPVPTAGGETGAIDAPTAPTYPGPTVDMSPPASSGEIGAPTRGIYDPPSALPQSVPYPYAPKPNAPYNGPYQYPPQPGQPSAYVPPQPLQPRQPYPYPQRPPVSGSEALGLKPNFAAMLGYFPFVGIGAAFLLVILEPARNRFVRFHAKQALIAQAAFWVILTVFNVAHGHISGVLSVLLYLPEILFIIGSCIGMFFMMGKTYAGERIKIPIIGDQAE